MHSFVACFNILQEPSNHCYMNYIFLHLTSETGEKKWKNIKDVLFYSFVFNFGCLVSCLGYVEALVIPAGARRIKVVEEKPAHSYLGTCHMF